jgi:hypothetical protein
MRYLLSLLSQQHLIHTRPSYVRAYIFILHALLVVCLLPVCAPRRPRTFPSLHPCSCLKCNNGERNARTAAAAACIYSGVMIVGLAARGCCCGVMNDSPSSAAALPRGSGARPAALGCGIIAHIFPPRCLRFKLARFQEPCARSVAKPDESWELGV